MTHDGRNPPRRTARLASPRVGAALALLLLACAPCIGGATANPDLAVVRSKYYLIHSDLDDALIYDLGKRMDAMYDEYSRRMSDFDLRVERKPLDVYLFNRKADYASFTQN